MWAIKYKPKNLKEFVNQKNAVLKFLNWLKKWKPGRALLFYGPPGTGKTCLIEAFAIERNFEFIELNASDWRSKKQIEEILGQTINSMPIFRKGKIILIDEVDGIAGREDVGGVGAIIKIIKNSRFPIILTANDPYAPKLKRLIEYCELIEFKPLHVYDIEKRLTLIARKEGIKVDKKVLRELAKRSKGDLRAAITDLEIVSEGKKEVKINDLEVLGFREREKLIFDVLKTIFKSSSAIAAKISLMQADRDPEEVFWWIEENIPKEYEKAEEIARAFEALSKADLFRTYIVKRQHWKFFSYFSEMLSAGVALSKKEMYRKFTKYSPPTILKILGQMKKAKEIRENALGKLGRALHCSTKKVKSEFLPYLKIILSKKEFERKILEKLDLSKEDFKIMKAM